MKVTKDNIKQYADRGLLGSLYVVNIVLVLLFLFVYLEELITFEYWGAEPFGIVKRNRLIFSLIIIPQILIGFLLIFFSFKYNKKSLIRIILLLIFPTYIFCYFAWFYFFPMNL